MAARLSVADGKLIVEIEGLHKLWVVKNRIEIPLAEVRGATADPGMVREPKGLRNPGMHVPGMITAGTFYRDQDRVFWDVKDPARAVVIELSGDAEYARLVVEVAEPRTAVALIEDALRA
ncbi:hypothetical protein ABZ864_24090 [Streptomyces sp. NPDC047082]|uniref:hypothetical protein n=1 Tax=Streptomyces sp. NPDC047082 TaxID=3155259 RepID=UPI0033EFC225